ncbi:TlpA family protein disulfide reductase [Solimicrobium silvestre]|uniref:AhpC/TSA family n=1 Tax=Solimicrobium silvestre TaxID=2099400 RepID=A0A2S9H312_9BURK|nr:TlpA disulfide reductase family protein [Solimicrobium silvestre]PRC94256.1 AhpC/TSA family [Solimicrobium silvestre]
MKLNYIILMMALGVPALQPFEVFAANSALTAFPSTSLPDVDGRAHNFNEWGGKIRVVNFWATWCAPCRNEIPLLSAISREWHAKDVEVIGVAIDGSDDVRAFINEAKIAYPVLLAEQQGQGLMQSGGNAMGALPFTLLLDRRGNIIQRHAGVLDARLLKQWLAEATAKPK